jgi:hypothetical protein
MKRYILFLTLIIGGFTANAQTTPFKSFEDKTELYNYTSGIWRNFKAFIKSNNGQIGDTLNIRIFTLPTLTTMHKDSIFIPMYKGMPPVMQGLFTMWGDSPANGRVLFDAAFNWFYIPHEMAHYQQYVIHKLGNDGFDNEYKANEIAVSFWMQQGDEQKLLALHKLFAGVLVKLKDPVPAGNDPKKWFADNYGKIQVDPNIYGFFQLRMVNEIIDNRNKIGIKALIIK